MSKVIILVGIPGCGKSTYASLILKDQGYFIINQDTLGNRDACIAAMRAALVNNLNVVIDRTNINKKQRQYFIDASRDANYSMPYMECILFESNFDVCMERLKKRENHPTISKNMTNDEKAAIIKKFINDFERPEISEGFDKIIIQKV